MNNILCILLITAFPLLSAQNAEEICTNGVFKCVSSTSLRICLNGQLVTSEFTCPADTYCSEDSTTICTFSDYEYSDYMDLNDPRYKPENNPNLNCTKQGLFPISKTYCTEYYKCIPKNGAYLTRKISCPSNNFFDPTQEKCSPDYICTEVDCNPLNIPKCEKTAKLPISNTGCKKYVNCISNTNGYEQKEQICNVGYFNPLSSYCDKNYKCPDSADICTLSTTKDPIGTTPESTTVSITTTTEPTTTTTEPTTTTTKPTTTTTEPTTTTTEPTTTTNRISTEEPDIPKCTESGRFPVPNSNCSQYYLCIPSSSGLLQQKFTCPEKYYFDPKLQKCSSSYVCNEIPTDPPIQVTTTTTRITNTPESTTASITTTTEPTTTTTEPTTTTTEPTTTTTTNKIPTEDPVIPKCTESGRFPVPNSNCSQYYLCSLSSSGLLQQKFTCPEKYYFDPILQKCSSSYVCNEIPTDPPIQDTTTTTTTTITTTTITTPTIPDSTPDAPSISECTEAGRFPVPNSGCSKYYLCTASTSGLVQQIFDCPQNSLFDPKIQRCTIQYICNDNSNPPNITEPSTTETTITTDTITESSSREPSTPINEVSTPTKNPTTQECEKAGRFPVPNTDCKIYYLCIVTTEGFEKHIYDCPENELFDPVEERCKVNYNCAEPPVEGKCKEQGSFPISDTNCMQYLKCTVSLSGFIEEIQSCEKDKYFDPSLELCLENYVCPELPTPTTTTTTTTTEAPSNPSEEKCEQHGKFPIHNTNCEEYLSCTVTSDGFLEQKLKCVDGTYFDPTLQKCTTNYICSELIPTSPEACQSEGRFPIKNTECKKFRRCMVTSEGFESDDFECAPDTLFDPLSQKCTKTYICNEVLENNLRFGIMKNNPAIPKCTKPGRFPISHCHCKMYYLCVLTSTGLEQYVHKCSDNELFDPVSQTCKINYNCDEDPPIDPPVSSTQKPSGQCKEQGKFSIKNTNCTQFLSCTTDSNGFIEEILHCIKGEYFNPLLQTCSENYICPEIPPNSSKCKEHGKFPISDTKCTEFVSCSVTSDGFLEQKLKCPDETYFDPALQKCTESYNCPELATTPNPLICTEAGNFPLENTGCKKYRSCVVTNHGFESIEYTCGPGTLFNPSTKKCSSTYKCTDIQRKIIEECGINQITIPECTTQGRFAIEGHCKKYVLCTKTRVGYKRHEYECPNDTNFDPKVMKCLKNYKCVEKPCQQNYSNLKLPNCELEGNQPIPGTKCKKFLLCTETETGFIHTVNTCPSGTLFHPLKKLCTENYICKEDKKSCVTLGRFPDYSDKTCKYYFDCTERSINNIQGIRKECRHNTLFDPKIQQCNANYICPNMIKVKRQTNRNVISPKFLVNGECTTIGRYLVQLSNCKNYTYCSVNTDGSLKATNFVCPTTTVFNQAIQKCSASYICPDSYCANNPGLLSWANPNVKDCSSYISCQPVFDLMGMILGYSGVIVRCPQGTKFNPMLQICDALYVCPNNIGK